jgi:hypothetical protein
MWAVQATLLRLENEPNTRKLLEDMLSAGIGVLELDDATHTVGLYVTTYRRREEDRRTMGGYVPEDRNYPTLEERGQEAVAHYNNTFYAPQVYVAAATELARRADLKNALRSYVDLLAQADLELASIVENHGSNSSGSFRKEQFLDHYAKAARLVGDFQRLQSICRPNVFESKLTYVVPKVSRHVINRGDIKPPNYPAEAMDRLATLNEHSERLDPRRAAYASAATVVMFFSGEPPLKEKLPVQAHKALASLVSREEQNIAQSLRNAALEELALYEVSDFLGGKPTFHGTAGSLPAVKKAISDRRLALAGLVADGSDTRSFTERAKANAPPSKADIVALIAGTVMEQSRGTMPAGTRFERTSESKISVRGSGISDEWEVDVWNLECAPEGRKQRCRYTDNLIVREKKLLGVREYSGGIETHDILLEWGDNGLKTDDPSRLSSGVSLVAGPPRSSGSSSSGPNMVDLQQERDQENRQRYYDRQQGERTNQPYEPSKRY